MFKKTFFIVTTVLFVLSLATGCSGKSSSSNTSTRTIMVDGMTCEGCEKTIEVTVYELEGIEDIKASHTAKNVTVTFDTLKVSLLDITGKIGEAGYTVKGE